MFKGVVDLVSRLFGVALELIDASLGAQPGVPVARPKYFLVAPLAAWALWASFLAMLMATSFVV